MSEAYQLSPAAPEQLIHAAELADFGHHGRHLAAKLLLNLVYLDGGVIQHIMQQRGNNGGFSPAAHSALSSSAFTWACSVDTADHAAS